MAVITTSKSFQKFGDKFSRIFNETIPRNMGHIQGIRIGFQDEIPSNGSDVSYKVGDSIKRSGVYAANLDSLSNVQRKPYWAEKTVENFVNFVGGQAVQDSMNRSVMDLISKGFTEEAAAKQVKDSLADKVSYNMNYDPNQGCYVVNASVKDAPDAGTGLFGNTPVLPFDIAWMTKIFKQPLVGSRADLLVAKESFGNPWADLVAVVTEGFEGFGKLSTVARGNLETNHSAPVGNKWGQIISNVVNLSVEYESSVAEEIRAGQKGNWVTAQGIGDRERYADFILRQMSNNLIYFGDVNSGLTGLIDVPETVEAYTAGDNFTKIMTGTDANKGSKIVSAFLRIIGDFMQELKYIPANNIKVNVSTHVFNALTSVTYSETYSAELPITVLQNQGKAFAQISLGGANKVGIDIAVDPMLDASTPAAPNPYNPNDYDYMFITVPSIKDELGSDQQNLVIHPELLDRYIVPPQYSRNGILYTMYKRVGGIIAPVQNTVKVLTGVGYNAAP